MLEFSFQISNKLKSSNTERPNDKKNDADEGLSAVASVKKSKNHYRYKRLQMLHNEVNVARRESAERTRVLENRGSFLVVTSGIIIAAATQAYLESQDWLIFWSLILAALGVILAIYMMRPKTALTLDIAQLYDEYFDSHASHVSMESTLVVRKKAEVLNRDKSNVALGRIGTVGFTLVVFSVALLIVGLMQ